MSKARKHYKAAKDRRTGGLTIWFTEAELKEVKRRAAALHTSNSTWVRDQLLSLMAMP